MGAEEKIGRLIENVKSKKRKLQLISFKRKKKTDFFELTNTNDPIDPVYLENLYEHLFFAHTNWLTALKQTFQYFVVDTLVDQNGDIEHDELFAKVFIYNDHKHDMSWINLLQSHLKQFVPYHQFIQKIDVQTTRYELSYSTILMKIDRLKFMKIRRNPVYDCRIEDQWDVVIGDIYERSKDIHTESHEIPVHDGKMLIPEIKTKTVVKV